MKRTLFAICFALAAAFTYSWRLLTDAIDCVYRVYRTARDITLGLARAVLQLASPAQDVPAAGQVTRTQARQFVNRQAQRERPMVTPGWRAVPSI